MVELLLSMPKALGSIPSTRRKTETEEGGRERKGREENCRGAAVKNTYPSLVAFQEREPTEGQKVSEGEE